MSGAELVLGIIGAVDVCFKWGNALVKVCQDFRHADAQLKDATTRVEACWMRIYFQLSVLRRIETWLDEESRDIHFHILEALSNKLRAAQSKLAKLLASQSPEARKAKFALFKKSLIESIQELEAWQGRFDPGWFMMMKMATSDLDQHLRTAAKEVTSHNTTGAMPSAFSTAVYLRRALGPSQKKTSAETFTSNGLIPNSSESIEFSPATTALRVDNQQRVLLDPISRGIATNAVLKNSRSLATKLRHADPFTFGLLECKALLKKDLDPNSASTDTQLSFIFRIPPQCKSIESLRSKLLGGSSSEYNSLTGKMDLARQLVRGVTYVHIYDFVHKNIRPETVLLLKTTTHEETSSRLLEPRSPSHTAAEHNMKETAVLVGFESFRNVDGNTHRLGDDDWEKNIYRHPSRQGKNPEMDYDMRHDIYSVGVCLLEIGLWETFVVYRKSEYESDSSDLMIPLPGPRFVIDSPKTEKQKENRNGDGGRRQQQEQQFLKNPFYIKDHMLHLARGELRRKMGDRYSQVVETCLTCLDEGNEDFGSAREGGEKNTKDFEDEDGIIIGYKYIEKVVDKLADIVI